MSEKRDNQRDKILTWLRMRGERGVLNTELTELCMRFGARIHELRKAGYDIKTEKLDESRYRFLLISLAGDHGGTSSHEASVRAKTPPQRPVHAAEQMRLSL